MSLCSMLVPRALAISSYFRVCDWLSTPHLTYQKETLIFLFPNPFPEDCVRNSLRFAESALP